MTSGLDLPYNTYIALSKTIKNDGFLDVIKASAVVFFYSNPMQHDGSGLPFRLRIFAASLNGFM